MLLSLLSHHQATAYRTSARPNGTVQDTLAAYDLADTPLTRQRLLTWGRDALRAALFNRLLGIIDEDPSARTALEQKVYDAFSDEAHTRILAATEDAQAEYQRWLLDPCAFRPPAPFTYRAPDACLSQTAGALLGLFGAAQPPTLKEFEAYGLYDAFPELQDSHFVAVTAGTAAHLAVLSAYGAGLAGGTIAGYIGRTGALGAAKLLSRLFPFVFFDVEETVGALGGFALGGPVGIVIDGAVTLVLHSIDVANAAKLPGQLRAAVTAAQQPTDLKALLDEKSGAGQQELFTLFTADTLPEFDPDPNAGPLPDPLPTPASAGVAFVAGPQNGAQAPADTITYKGWNGATHQAYLTDDGWFVDTDTATGAISLTLGLDYLNGQGQKWTANRGGSTFTLDSYESNFVATTSDTIDYKDAQGHNEVARLVVRNVPPAFTPGPDVTVDKNAGAYSAAWATGIAPGAPSEAGQTVSFSATADNTGLFTADGQPTVAPDGTLSFTLAPDAYGAATVTVMAHDNGGTADGGHDTSAPQTFTIAVSPRPSFTPNDVTVAEDSGHYSKAWATGIGGAGPDSTAGLSFAAAADHPELFTAGGQPVVSSDGALSFTPAPNANGRTTVRVTLTDNDAFLPGGYHPTVTKTFTLIITPVNDPPHIATYDRTVYVHEGVTQAFPIGYLGINDAADTAWGGPPLLPATLLVTVPGDEPKAGAVAYDPVQGLVYYTPNHGSGHNGGYFGYDAFGFQICDNGFPGSACATQLVTVIILPPNQAPSFTPGGSPVVSAGSGPFSEPWATEVNPNAPGTSYDYNQHVNFLVTADNLALFSVQPRIAYDAVSKVGTLMFTPTPGVSGTTVVTATAHDDGGTAYGGVDTSDPVTFTVTIQPAPLTVTANGAVRPYGDPNPPFTGTLTGVQNGDTITATYGSTATATTPVGSYAITPTLSDPDGRLGNYAVALISGTLTIAQAPLTVTANDAARPYGAANPPFTGTLSGLKNNDAITASYGSTATATTPAGSYAIAPTLADPSGALGNYAITKAAGTLTITQAPLTVTANDKSMTYGGAVPTFTASDRGLVNGESGDVVHGLTCGAVDSNNVPVSSHTTAGTYPITCGGGSAANYSITYMTGALTIKPTPLTITADDKTTPYGTVPSVTWTGSGFVNGESATTLATAPNSAPTCGATVNGAAASATTPPGVYAGAITCRDAVDPNYAITYAGGTLTVDPLLSLDEQGLPSGVRRQATLDGQTVSLPDAGVEIAYDSVHRYSFPATVTDSSGAIYITTDAGFSGTVTANISDTATYQTMAQVISAALSSGGIDNGGQATALTRQFNAVQQDIKAGATAQALADLHSFAALVRAQAGKHIATATAQALLAAAQLVYASLGGTGTV